MRVVLTITDEKLSQDPAVIAWVRQCEKILTERLNLLTGQITKDLAMYGTVAIVNGERVNPKDIWMHTAFKPGDETYGRSPAADAMDNVRDINNTLRDRRRQYPEGWIERSVKDGGLVSEKIIEAFNRYLEERGVAPNTLRLDATSYNQLADYIEYIIGKPVAGAFDRYHGMMIVIPHGATAEIIEVRYLGEEVPE